MSIDSWPAPKSVRSFTAIMIFVLIPCTLGDNKTDKSQDDILKKELFTIYKKFPENPVG